MRAWVRTRRGAAAVAAVATGGARRSRGAVVASPTSHIASVRTPHRRSAAAQMPLSRTDMFTINCELSLAESPEHVLRAVIAHRDDLNVVNLTHAWYRLHEATSTWSPSERRHFFLAHAALFDAMVALMRERAPHFDARGLANAAYTCAQLGHPAAIALLVDVLAPVTSARIAELNAYDLSNCAWAAATVGARGRASPASEGAAAEVSPALLELLERARDAAIPRIADFSPQGLANTLWALTTARVECAALRAAAERAALTQLERFEPIGLSAMLWAYARAGERAPNLFRAAHAVVARRLHELSPRELTNALWAYSREYALAADGGHADADEAGARCAELVHAASAGMDETRLRAFNGGELARLLHLVAAEADARLTAHRGGADAAGAEAARAPGGPAPVGPGLLFSRAAAQLLRADRLAELSAFELTTILSAFARADALLEPPAGGAPPAGGGAPAAPLSRAPARAAADTTPSHTDALSLRRALFVAAAPVARAQLRMRDFSEPSLVALLAAYGSECERERRPEARAAGADGGAGRGAGAHAADARERERLLRAAGIELATRGGRSSARAQPCTEPHAHAAAHPDADLPVADDPIKVLTVTLAFARARVASPPALRAWLRERCTALLPQFGPRELSLLVRALVVSSSAEPALISATHAEVAARARSGALSTRELQDVAWAFAHAAASEAPGARASAASSAAGSAGSASAEPSLRALVRESPVFDALADGVDPHACSRAQLAELVWAFRASGHARAATFLDRAVPAVRAHAARMRPHQLSVVLYALASAGVAEPALFRELAPLPPPSAPAEGEGAPADARADRSTGAPGCAAAGARARAGRPGAQPGADEAGDTSPTSAARLRGFEPAAIAHLAAAYATADPNSAETRALVGRVADAAATHERALSVHDAALLSWAMAQACVRHGALMERVAVHTLSALHGAGPGGAGSAPGAAAAEAESTRLDWRTTRSLSKLLWAYASVDGFSPLPESTRRLLPELGLRMVPHLADADDVDLAKLAWSLCSAAREPHARLLDELAAAVRARQLSAFGVGSLGLLAAAFAHARYHDFKLLGQIADASAGALRARCAPSELAHLAWAVATVSADPRAAPRGGFPRGAELLGLVQESLEYGLGAAPDRASAAAAEGALAPAEAGRLVWALGTARLLTPSVATTALLRATLGEPTPADPLGLGSARAAPVVARDGGDSTADARPLFGLLRLAVDVSAATAAGNADDRAASDGGAKPAAASARPSKE